IANAADEQRSVSEEINRNIMAISDTAQRSTTGAEQISSASKNLKNLSANLVDIVKSFQV
ncbi:MAG: methyl-accepting chemotaxis protein, partial [Thiohalomonadales bacterium]